ncbi:MAG: ABC transporter ATP-binding protein [Burkholderiales bacterium]|nr:ABC transporter ATP-binding protein [Burkholderiales bacterium]
MSWMEAKNLDTWIANRGKLLHVVDAVSLAVKKGETFALVGESGCGKSMTSLSILRLLPDAGKIAGGQVLLEGVDLLELPERKMRDVRGKRIGIIFQEPALSLNPVMRVGEQIGEVLERHFGMKGEARRARVAELLAQVGIPDPDLRAADYPFQLSGGMKQRVMIAMALAGEPDMLIADEPTTALDVTIQAQILELLRSIQNRNGMSILLITHDLGVVSEMADRVAVMYAGEIVEQAERDAFFASPAHPYSRKLFASLPGMGKRGGMLDVIRGSVPSLSGEFSGCRFADRCDHAWDLCRESAPSWFDAGNGSLARCHLYDGRGGVPRLAKAPAERGISGSGGVVLEVKNLKVHFPVRKGLLQRVSGKVAAVDGVSFSLEFGKTMALVGESGCGKTTTGKAILQLLKPTMGSVLYNGKDLAGLEGGELRRAREGLQIVFQDPYASLNPRMRVREIMEEGMKEKDEGRIGALLKEVGLSTDAMLRYPHEFSGGQRQRIAIARALAVNPRVLVLDEPTSALDVSVQAQILNLLMRLQQDHGLSYLFITHNLSAVEYLAHDVAVMYLGRIVEKGNAEKLLASPAHPYTRALLAAAPSLETRKVRETFEGELPSPLSPPPGCHYHSRCPQRMPVCASVYPEACVLADGREVRCHLYGDSP